MGERIELFGIYDRLVPGKERVALRVHTSTSLQPYALLLGKRASDGTFIPAIDQFFWLGPTIANGPGWVFVFTGRGTPSFGAEDHTKQPLYAVYWGKPTVIFEPGLEAALVHIDAVIRWQEDKRLPANSLRDYLQIGPPPAVKKSGGMV